jgi:hypothetical protein
VACRVCRACKLSYANSPDFNPCPICDMETIYVADGMPDTDIDVAVREALHVPAGQRKVLMWRRRELVDLGFSGAILEVLVESPVDLHELASLMARGCPSGLAVEILL